jgi:hypothetical protein
MTDSRPGDFVTDLAWVLPMALAGSAALAAFTWAVIFGPLWLLAVAVVAAGVFIWLAAVASPDRDGGGNHEGPHMAGS